MTVAHGTLESAHHCSSLLTLRLWLSQATNKVEYYDFNLPLS